jgi:hypothetical protein
MSDYIWQQPWAAAFAIAVLVSATCIGARVAGWLKLERESIRAQAREAERIRQRELLVGRYSHPEPGVSTFVTNLELAAD